MPTPFAPALHPPFQLVIFDVDGTLIDSFPVFVELMNSFAERYAYPPIHADNIEEFRALAPKKILKKLKLSPLQTFSLMLRCKHKMKQFLHIPQKIQGVEQLLRALKAQHIQIAIVSSNSAANCQSYLGAELFDLFDYIECDASIYGKQRQLKKIIRKVKAPLQQVIYIGDQIIDIQSAHKNGIQAAAVTWGFNNKQALLTEKPHYLCEEFTQLSQLLLPHQSQV